MAWFKVDDTLHSHPKARAAGLAAMGLWAVAGSHAGQYLTEGFVPEWFVASWPSGKRLADRLVNVGLWDVAEREGQQGWQFHQWDERNPSKEIVEEKRAETRRRVAEYRARKKAEKASGNAGGNGVTDPVSNPVSNGRPDPTRPDPSVVSSSVGTSPDVPREPDHRDEPRSSAVLPSAYVVAREYLDRVKLADKARVSGVVQQAIEGGYEQPAIKAALRRLAKDSRPVTPDTLRIEIEGKVTPIRKAAVGSGSQYREGW